MEGKIPKQSAETMDQELKLEGLIGNINEVLGDLREKVRAIKKTVLTGTEAWTIENHTVDSYVIDEEGKTADSVTFTLGVKLTTSGDYIWKFKEDNYIGMLMGLINSKLRDLNGTDEKAHYVSVVPSRSNNARSALRVSYHPERLPSQFE